MLALNFDPFPLLHSERLEFRAISENDVEEMFELRSNPETMRYIPRPLVTNHAETIEHIRTIFSVIDKKEGINWAIQLKGHTQLMGIIGIYRIKVENYRCELGYMLLPEHHNKGYISEAINTILNYAFNDISMHSVEAIIDPRNYPSEKVLQKNGFVKEAHILENEYYNGAFIDTVIYSILKRNFQT